MVISASICFLKVTEVKSQKQWKKPKETKKTSTYIVTARRAFCSFLIAHHGNMVNIQWKYKIRLISNVSDVHPIKVFSGQTELWATWFSEVLSPYGKGMDYITFQPKLLCDSMKRKREWRGREKVDPPVR